MSSKKKDYLSLSYEASMVLCNHIKNGDTGAESITSRWRDVFNCVLKYMGFGKKQRRFLWESLACGNWERLHQTSEEESLSPEKWLEMLRSDVFYCSDRWSLDRLMRCHWIFRQWYRSRGLGWRKGWDWL